MTARLGIDGRTTNGHDFLPEDRAFSRRFTAQYAFILWDSAFRAAALIPPRRGVAPLAAGRDIADVFFTTRRPPRLVEPCNASIALLSRSRSAISKSSMWSVGIGQNSSTTVNQ